MTMKLSYKDRPGTKWHILTEFPNEPKDRWRERAVYVDGPKMFYANISGMKARLEPIYNVHYHDGKIPLHFKVTGWENR